MEILDDVVKDEVSLKMVEWTGETNKLKGNLNKNKMTKGKTFNQIKLYPTAYL